MMSIELITAIILIEAIILVTAIGFILADKYYYESISSSRNPRRK